jgi:hypothetical protein
VSLVIFCRVYFGPNLAAAVFISFDQVVVDLAAAIIAVVVPANRDGGLGGCLQDRCTPVGREATCIDQDDTAWRGEAIEVDCKHSELILGLCGKIEYGGRQSIRV